MEERMTLADLVRVYRNRRGLSLSEAGAIAGCSKPHLHDIEKGRTTNPTIATVIGLARALQMKPQTVFLSALKTAGYDPEAPAVPVAARQR